ncbi:hypothetical protein PNK_1077 [Candidatus Protochlamydia naegleriophila]|uniref:Uncharacterized protein n=1 Tax=Candidatus Protochlamydia naegleriophila TaxID=389348 RepID=A0A0U5JG12_9BACT|nr:hypothetical protein [Candidatus Protochlamydia naegleriophila]CUI16694.1 hypothetical protein PNK_1077 [Candidatus Protochlamydia naegleriophila]
MFDFLKRHLKEIVFTALSLVPMLVSAEHHGGGHAGGNPSWSAASRQRYSYDKVPSKGDDHKGDERKYYRGGDRDYRYYGHGHRRTYYNNNYYYAAPSPYYGGYAYPSYYYSYPYYAYPYDGYYSPYYDTGPNVGLYLQLGN